MGANNSMCSICSSHRDGVEKNVMVTRLFQAVRSNDLEVVEELCNLAKDSNDFFTNNPDPRGNTALHIAAELGRVEVVKILVSKGADIKNVNHMRQTPADCANLAFQRTGNPYWRERLSHVFSILNGKQMTPRTPSKTNDLLGKQSSPGLQAVPFPIPSPARTPTRASKDQSADATPAQSPVPLVRSSMIASRPLGFNVPMNESSEHANSTRASSQRHATEAPQFACPPWNEDASLVKPSPVRAQPAVSDNRSPKVGRDPAGLMMGSKTQPAVSDNGSPVLEGRDPAGLMIGSNSSRLSNLSHSPTKNAGAGSCCNLRRSDDIRVYDAATHAFQGTHVA